MINFQRFERLLKEILAKSQVEGAPADFLRIARRREETVSRLTLGILVKEFVGSVHSADSRAEPADAESPEDWEGSSRLLPGKRTGVARIHTRNAGVASTVSRYGLSLIHI